MTNLRFIAVALLVGCAAHQAAPAAAAAHPVAAAPAPEVPPPPACDDYASCEQACAADNGDACAKVGEADLEAHTEDKAAPRLERGCKLGSSEACALLGVLLVDGRGIEPNPPRALALWTITCQQGTAMACESLAVHQESGHFAPKDDAAALGNHVRACDLGEPRACRNAAIMIDEGRGATADETTQQQLLDKACSAGDTLGCGMSKQLADRVHPVQRVHLTTFNVGFAGAHFYKGTRTKAEAKKLVDRAIKDLDAGKDFAAVAAALGDPGDLGVATHAQTLVRTKHEDAEMAGLFALAPHHAAATDNPSFGFIVWYRD